MATPAALPWIQFDEPVSAENEPTGKPDVANRVDKFIMTQSDFLVTDAFPGFIPAYKGVATPEGIVDAAPATAFIDTAAQNFYVKMTPKGSATGWKVVGNPAANGSPEGVIGGSVGQMYEQRDAATTMNPVWVKRSGSETNTGWRALGGFAGTGTNSIEIGSFATGGAIGNDGIAIGREADVKVAATNGVAIGRNSEVTGADGVAIGFAASAAASSVAISSSTGTATSAIAILGTLTGAPTAAICIGLSAAISNLSLRTIAIGNNAVSGTGADQILIGKNTVGGASSGCVVIGNAASNLSAGVAIDGTIGNHGSIKSICICGTIAATGLGNAISLGGTLNQATGAICIGFGSQIVTGADNCTVVGYSSVANDDRQTLYGNGATGVIAHVDSIVIGVSAQSIGARCATIGGGINGSGITTMLLGQGVNTRALAAEDLTIRMCNASGGANDLAGANMILVPARGTGAGVPGDFQVQLGTPTGTSAITQAAATRFAVRHSAVALDTHMMVWDVDNGVLERVSVGAANSGGAGFKVLCIPN